MRRSTMGQDSTDIGTETLKIVSGSSHGHPRNPGFSVWFSKDPPQRGARRVSVVTIVRAHRPQFRNRNKPQLVTATMRASKMPQVVPSTLFRYNHGSLGGAQKRAIVKIMKPAVIRPSNPATRRDDSRRKCFVRKGTS